MPPLISRLLSNAQIPFFTSLQSAVVKAVLVGSCLVGYQVANAALLYQVTTPDGRIVTVNNPTKAYQLNPDTSKITIIDTDKLADYSTQPSTSNPATTSAAYTTTSTKTADTTTTTVTVNQPITATTPVSTPEITDFEELNISSTQASRKGDYRLTIMNPAPETLYRRPAQDIDVSLSVTPALKKGDTVNLEIDGKVVKNGNALTHQLPITEIVPGKHTLSTTILNVINQPIAQASTTIYVVQNTPLIQRQRQLKKQLAAYDALPWYEKLKVRLGFEDNTKNVDEDFSKVNATLK